VSNLSIKTKAKDIKLKGPELEGAILSTMKTLSDVVGATLGPGGNPVLLERPGMPPLITKDGVTVAMHCAFQDALQHVISEAAKEASLRTNREAGDGTTTAIVLAEALVRYGAQWIKENSNHSPQQVCRELNQMSEWLVDQLRARGRKIENNDDLLKVALVSSNFDDGIAKAVVEAIDMVGNDGTIITEEGARRDTYVEVQEGFPIQKGLRTFGPVQELFINNPADQECVLTKPLFLLYDGDLNDVLPIGGYLGSVFSELGSRKEIRPVVIVAHKFSPQVLRMCAANFQSGILMVPLETPASAQTNSRHHFLLDVAAFTGATVLDPITKTFESMTPDGKEENQTALIPLGACSRARIGRDQTLLFDALEENKEVLKERVENLKVQMKNAESEYDSEIIKERIANLLGGIATIYVGGSSDLEIKEKKHRIEDAICATRSAIEEGILPGGGAMLTVLAWELQMALGLPLSKQILANALTEPFNRIAVNAGVNLSTIGEAKGSVVDSVVDGVPTRVYDSLNHLLTEPYGAGIVDPVKVTISALRNALSIAQMLFTLGGAIVLPRDIVEERQGEMQAQNLAAQMQGA
jgi:chaperonin GroEL